MPDLIRVCSTCYARWTAGTCAWCGGLQTAVVTPLAVREMACRYERTCDEAEAARLRDEAKGLEIQEREIGELYP